MNQEKISDRLISFGVRVLSLCDALPQSFAGKYIKEQLIQAGTAVGIEFELSRLQSEAEIAQLSFSDAAEYLVETIYWLKLIKQAEIIKPERLEALLKEASEIQAMFAKQLKSSGKE